MVNMPNFSEVMSQNSTAQLLKIVNEERIDYTPEAVAAAEKELTKRNLSVEQLEVANEELKQMNAATAERSNEPLGLDLKILSLLMPGLILLFVSRALKGEGYYRKAKELVRWNVYGLMAYVSLIILMFVFAKIFFS